jgi:hypothetical protein
VYLEEFFNRCIVSSCRQRNNTSDGDATLGHRGDAQIAVEHEVAVGGLQEVERNLCGLTMGVPPLRRRMYPCIYKDIQWESPRA